MVHACGVAYGLARALHRLSWMALQPQGPREDDPGPIAVIEAEIDRAGLLEARPTFERRLKLPASAVEIACKVQGNAENGMGERGRDRIFQRLRDRGAAPCIEKRGFEVSAAQVEHVQRTQKSDLLVGVSVLAGDGQASVKRRPRRIDFSPQVHQGRSERRLEMHLLDAAA